MQSCGPETFRLQVEIDPCHCHCHCHCPRLRLWLRQSHLGQQAQKPTSPGQAHRARGPFGRETQQSRNTGKQKLETQSTAQDQIHAQDGFI
ncbi:hypothetical protein LA080_005553 [Diaporthe eres]|nr:hypothetical protein LA080_005553 [Diaporthe eres]